VQTNNGGAVVQYRKGVRVSLAAESVADFASARVQLEKGLMRFETSSNGVTFAASTLRLEPTTVRTVGNVTLRDSKASVSVTEGTLKVVDPSGVQLASLNAGEARLFEEGPDSTPASPSASAKSPSTPPSSGPPSTSTSSQSSKHKWLIAAGMGVAGLTVGLGLGLHGSNSNSSNAGASASLGVQAQSQSAAIATQLNALNSQAASLKALLDAASSSSSQAKSLDAQLAAQQALLTQAQAELAALNAQINSQGGQATPTQISELQSLAGQLSTIQSNIISIQNAYNSLPSISLMRVG